MNIPLYKKHIEFTNKLSIQEGSSGDLVNGKNISEHNPDITKSHYRFSEIIKQHNCINILEIGFNVGHGSACFLSCSEMIKVHSFDICRKGREETLRSSKDHIDLLFPNRHRLTIGDSKITIPAFHKDHPRDTFDFILIDGDHSISGAERDILNCKNLANKDTIIVMDDVVSDYIGNWTKGPSIAWEKSIKNNLIIQLGREDHVSKSRGIAWGKYNIK